jgi:hypothetical protein
MLTVLPYDVVQHEHVGRQGKDRYKYGFDGKRIRIESENGLDEEGIDRGENQESDNDDPHHH